MYSLHTTRQLLPVAGGLGLKPSAEPLEAISTLKKQIS
jgi:hypothetical protein